MVTDKFSRSLSLFPVSLSRRHSSRVPFVLFRTVYLWVMCRVSDWGRKALTLLSFLRLSVFRKKLSVVAVVRQAGRQGRVSSSFSLSLFLAVAFRAIPFSRGAVCFLSLAGRKSFFHACRPDIRRTAEKIETQTDRQTDRHGWLKKGAGGRVER
mmetsp:Transcript_39237/g.77207  ORF Transcript_39237/g.77207 Transcript_39237/m.77207 type:complete len:154 (-) Transcript_39237:329-790(-)